MIDLDWADLARRRVIAHAADRLLQHPDALVEIALAALFVAQLAIEPSDRHAALADTAAVAVIVRRQLVATSPVLRQRDGRNDERDCRSHRPPGQIASHSPSDASHGRLI